jgi:hypothetical protein
MIDKAKASSKGLLGLLPRALIGHHIHMIVNKTGPPTEAA